MIFWLIPKELIYGLLCAGVLKSLNSSTFLGARLTYLTLSFILAVLCLLVKIYSASFFAYIDFIMPFCKSGACLSTKLTQATMLSLSLFHFTVLILTSLFRRNSAKVYQQLWPVKILLFLAILSLSIYMTNRYVLVIQDFYAYVSLPLAFLYIFIQSLYLVDLSYDWNDTWYENYTNSSSCFWAFMLISFTLVCWIANAFLLYLTYGTNNFFYVFVFFFSCFILTGISSSILSENGCNFYLALLSCSISVTIGMFFMVSSLRINERFGNECEMVEGILSFFLMFYVAMVYNEGEIGYDHSESQGHTEIYMTDMKNLKDLDENKLDDHEIKSKADTVNYTYFQGILISYCCYLGMVLINWAPEKSANLGVVVGCFHGILIVLIYIWSLIAPVMFPDREFSR